MKKILIATGLYPPEIGGPATHTRMLEQALLKKGVEVKVVPFSSVRKVPKLLRHLLYVFKVYQASAHTDLVFAQDAVSTGLPALVAAYLRRVPFVVRIPGDYAWEQARERFGVRDSVIEFQHRQYGTKIEAIRRVQKFVVQKANHVVVSSKFMGGIVQKWSPKRVTIIYNGMEMSYDSSTPSDLPRPPRAVTASRLIRGKGFECLIELMAELPAWHLVIVGDGPLMNELKERAQKAGVADRVLFTGAVNKEEMFGWYKAATAFILNTEFESFSFQVLEALAMGAPTISTRVGAIPEILENDKEGLLVEPNDKNSLKKALESVCTDTQRWRERVRLGKLKAQEFSEERCVDQFGFLFRSVIESKV